MMQQEEWMNLQEFRPLADAGVPWSEIARLAGCDPRTAKKYLSGVQLVVSDDHRGLTNAIDALLPGTRWHR